MEVPLVLVNGSRPGPRVVITGKWRPRAPANASSEIPTAPRPRALLQRHGLVLPFGGAYYKAMDRLL
ncbi:hypothetical protein ACFYO0_36465 [Streptomyces sp. NPDC006365]|uniref:hypothetical protein n=1 Tax=Streptomyces sp. NPDC006365 TaxID=3364744 RepID=UPI0036AD904A